jgi:hypothetical protein
VKASAVETPHAEENKEAASVGAQASVAQQKGAVTQIEEPNTDKRRSSSEIKPGIGEMMGTGRTDEQGKPANADGTNVQIKKPAAHGKKETGPVPGQATRAETESAPGQIDKSALPIGAPRRIRDKEHLRYVAHQPCLICGRSPGHAHHLRFAQPRALGRKVSDEWVVPLCATHHRALHGVGDEECWWKERGIDPIGHAQILWWTTRFGNVSDIDGGPSSRLKAQLSNPSSNLT